jgi:hypothetical protein
MLADKGIVKTELVGKKNGLSVLMQGFGGVPVQRVQGHGEVT